MLFPVKQSHSKEILSNDNQWRGDVYSLEINMYMDVTCPNVIYLA